MPKYSKEEMQQMEFEQINNQQEGTIQWKPNEGESLIGEYTEKREDCGFEKYTFYIINDGEDEYSLLANTVLTSLFEHIHVGDIIKITYEGFKKAQQSQREYKDYSIQKAKFTPANEFEIEPYMM